MKEYSTFGRSQGLEHHDQMQFIVISKTCYGFYPQKDDTVSVFQVTSTK